MTKTTLIVVTCGLTAAASARQNAVRTRLSPDNGASWYPSLAFGSGGGLVTVQVGFFYERASGYGFSGSVHNIIIDNLVVSDVFTLPDRPDSAQHPDGRQGRFNFGAQRQQVYRAGTDARVAAANNTQNSIAGGISVKQNTPVASGSQFDTSNPALGFRFDLTIDTSTGFRAIHINTPRDRMLNFAVYSTSQSTSGTNQDLASVALDGAAVFVYVPAPSSSVLLGFGGVAMIRRRRRLD